jgi:hypothetical protein
MHDSASQRTYSEVAVVSLEATVEGILEEHGARARPSPYAKRWWTDELKTLGFPLSAARNRLTTVRCRGQEDAEAAAGVKLVNTHHSVGARPRLSSCAGRTSLTNRSPTLQTNIIIGDDQQGTRSDGAETYRLLPENHFGGRPDRLAEQALNLLVEKIHEAWRAYRVLSLVSFDVQGVFNGVHPTVLAEWSRERRIPSDLVAWIEGFCNGRKASVVVGDYEPPISEIEHAGIPQGSPLSLILYIFYNANLVHGRVEKSEGSISFVDDCYAWVTGPSAAENTCKLQTQQPRWAEK